jgi:hypothetical protein
MSDNDQGIAAVNMLRSKMRTLENLRTSSMFMHNRLTPAFFELANTSMAWAIQLGQEFKEDPEVQRWVEKYKEYAAQHKVNWNEKEKASK